MPKTFMRLLVLGAVLATTPSRASQSTDAGAVQATCHKQVPASVASGALPVDPAPGAAEQLPIAVDGAQTPDLIPDAIAYRLFIAAVSTAGTRATREELDRRDALLSDVALSADDNARFIAATLRVKDDVDTVEAARRKLAPLVPKGTALPDQQILAQFDQLRARQKQILDDSVHAANAALSPEGKDQLGKFIRERVKRRIVIYGAPPSIPE